MRLLTAAAALLLAAPAQAETCLDRERIERNLATYGERVIVRAESEFRVVEVWYSEEHDTWSIVHTDTFGLTCVFAVGDSLTVIEPSG